MSKATTDHAVFLTLVRSPKERACARLVIDSIRAFGGALSSSPIWLFETDSQGASSEDLAGKDVQVFPLRVPDTVKGAFFSTKVFACARAEEMAASGVQSLIWIDPACLVIQPPLLFNLDESFDAAVRPVHIRNVGLPVDTPLDSFWNKIVENTGVEDIEGSVETYIEGERIRPYFNSHAFAINPSKGLLRQWFEGFEGLVSDETYFEQLRQDQLHHIFLHQAIWSVLLVTALDPERIRLLPSDYNYPYNLHDSVPVDRRAKALNDVVCIAYEDRSLDPNQVDDVDIHDPLRSWLLEHVGNSGTEG
jgi:hypothetical protein